MSFCRDCADNNGFCPNRSGLPCDPTDHDELTLQLKAQLEAIGEWYDQADIADGALEALLKEGKG